MAHDEQLIDNAQAVRGRGGMLRLERQEQAGGDAEPHLSQVILVAVVVADRAPACAVRRILHCR